MQRQPINSQPTNLILWAPILRLGHLCHGLVVSNGLRGQQNLRARISPLRRQRAHADETKDALERHSRSASRVLISRIRAHHGHSGTVARTCLRTHRLGSLGAHSSISRTFMNAGSPALGGGPAFPIVVLGLQAVSFAKRSHYPHCNYPLEPSPSTVYVALRFPSLYHEMKIMIAPLTLWLFIKIWIQRRAIERH
jgi:hypothetical protein